MNCNTTHYRANSSSVPGDPSDWPGFFGCFDADDLSRAAEELVPVYGAVFGRDDWFVAHCEAHGISLDALDEWEQRRRAAERGGVPGRRRSGDVMVVGEQSELGLSERQRELVAEASAAMRRALADVADPAVFLGEMVARIQSEGRGGAIPSTLFLGETLEQVVVTGDRARATRTVRGAPVAELAFTRRRGEWLVHLG